MAGEVDLFMGLGGFERCITDLSMGDLAFSCNKGSGGIWLPPVRQTPT